MGGKGDLIQSSFCCFKGLGRSAEQKLWEIGCLSWDRIGLLPEKTLSSKKMDLLSLEITQAKAALKAGMAGYFINRFKPGDQIRVLKDFQSQSAVIDIETTGLTSKDVITTIAVMKGRRIHVFINGMDLPDFLSVLKDVKLVITFNGARFDLPFLRRHFSIDLNIPHLDMMPILRNLGFTGGQKKCEDQFHLTRDNSQGISGMLAVSLWYDWKQKNDITALRQLALYNAEDVFMLEKLAINAYNLAMKSIPIRTIINSAFESKVLTLEMIRCIVL